MAETRTGSSLSYAYGAITVVISDSMVQYIEHRIKLRPDSLVSSIIQDVLPDALVL